MSQTPAGWFPDPERPGQQRYWNGAQWTEDRAPLTTQVGPPLPGTYPVPKQSHTLRNVLLILTGVAILFIGGCFAIVTVGINAVDDAIQEGQEADDVPGGPDNPLTIEPGKAFEVAGFNYLPGWSVERDVGMISVNGLRVENNRDSKDSALVEIKFWKGSEVLAVADCTTEPISPGTTTKLNCLGDADPARGYDRITINDLF